MLICMSSSFLLKIKCTMIFNSNTIFHLLSVSFIIFWHRDRNSIKNYSLAYATSPAIDGRQDEEMCVLFFLVFFEIVFSSFQMDVSQFI